MPWKRPHIKTKKLFILAVLLIFPILFLSNGHAILPTVLDTEASKKMFENIDCEGFSEEELRIENIDQLLENYLKIKRDPKAESENDGFACHMKASFAIGRLIFPKDEELHSGSKTTNYDLGIKALRKIFPEQWASIFKFGGEDRLLPRDRYRYKWALELIHFFQTVAESKFVLEASTKTSQESYLLTLAFSLVAVAGAEKLGREFATKFEAKGGLIKGIKGRITARLRNRALGVVWRRLALYGFVDAVTSPSAGVSKIRSSYGQKIKTPHDDLGLGAWGYVAEHEWRQAWKDGIAFATSSATWSFISSAYKGGFIKKLASALGIAGYASYLVSGVYLAGFMITNYLAGLFIEQYFDFQKRVDIAESLDLIKRSLRDKNPYSLFTRTAKYVNSVERYIADRTQPVVVDYHNQLFKAKQNLVCDYLPYASGMNPYVENFNLSHGLNSYYQEKVLQSFDEFVDNNRDTVEGNEKELIQRKDRLIKVTESFLTGSEYQDQKSRQKQLRGIIAPFVEHLEVLAQRARNGIDKEFISTVWRDEINHEISEISRSLKNGRTEDVLRFDQFYKCNESDTIWPQRGGLFRYGLLKKPVCNQDEEIVWKKLRGVLPATNEVRIHSLDKNDQINAATFTPQLMNWINPNESEQMPIGNRLLKYKDSLIEENRLASNGMPQLNSERHYDLLINGVNIALNNLKHGNSAYGPEFFAVLLLGGFFDKFIEETNYMSLAQVDKNDWPRRHPIHRWTRGKATRKEIESIFLGNTYDDLGCSSAWSSHKIGFGTLNLLESFSCVENGELKIILDSYTSYRKPHYQRISFVDQGTVQRVEHYLPNQKTPFATNQKLPDEGDSPFYYPLYELEYSACASAK